MRRIGTLAGIVAVLGAFSVAPAFAAPQTLFAAQQGNDGNPGTFASPVRHLAAALAIANAGDTIIIEQGDYGAGVIQDAITLLAPQGGGIFGPPGSPCLTINAPAGADILIDGLTCNQSGAALNGL